MALHAAGNVGGNMAFGSGALGFAHVLKWAAPPPPPPYSCPYPCPYYTLS